MQRPTRGRPSQVVGIIIPARNEADSLGHILGGLPRPLVHDVIVVDNGSTDATTAVAGKAGARVVAEPVAGYGRACLAGIAALDPSVDVVAFMDADNSDYPEELPLLLAPIKEGRADLVIGSRTTQAQPGSLTPQQRVGNWLACRLMRAFFGARYTDLGPFRAIRREALEQLHMQDQAFGWTVEMQAKAAIAGLRVAEVAVRYRPRIGRSKISGTLRGSLLAGAAILSTIFRLAWTARRQGALTMRRLLIFLKYPTPGQVKTRLAAQMGDETAAAIYRASAELTLSRLEVFRQEAVVYVDPPQALEATRRWLSGTWELRPQRGETLGDRLKEATAAAFDEGAGRVVVVGTDSPWLFAADVEKAFTVLEHAEMALGPTEDSGYYLIGLSKNAPGVFDSIAWSSSSVYGDTVAKAAALGLSVHVLPKGYDLDYPQDVRRFVTEESARGAASSMVDTMAVLMNQRRL